MQVPHSATAAAGPSAGPSPSAASPKLQRGSSVEELFGSATEMFGAWEVVKDIIDEMIDLSLNYRQSGHPGGSRSKVHMMVATLLSGAMRWDLLRPWRPYQDRFVLSAGHTVPVVYSALAVLNETVRARRSFGADERFEFPDQGRWALGWEDLMRLRHRDGLPGHAEMKGKSLFIKYNTGPSGHGMPPAAGEALALKVAGCGEVKVFCVEGEGGLSAGAAHETKNSAWGLGLSNLVFLIDWNDFGIDKRPHSSVVYGTPEDWFKPHGWRVVGTEDGMDWGPVTGVVLDAARGENQASAPVAAWFRTEKGRGYGKTGASSHGVAWPMNAPEFWAVRQRFMAKYGVEYEGFGQPAPTDSAERDKQARMNFQMALDLLYKDRDLTTLVSDRLVEVASLVPDRVEGFNLGSARPAEMMACQDLAEPRRYPAALWKKPGEKASNRAAMGAWGAYVNSYTRAHFGRPLFVVCSADLAESTSIAGFGEGFGDLPGWGWYDRGTNPTGTVMPQEITEFANAGIMAGLATVNLADDPFHDFNGLWGACSTYGSFTYLKYGALRLFSQLAQDSELKVGKLLYVAGHSGPETAEDSRTHFGIYEPGMTELFPDGHVVDLYPWEYNEVPVVLAAALGLDVPIVVLHLTKPVVEVPDRSALGIDSHFEAARGAYLLRDYRPGLPRHGTVVVRGTLTTANVVEAQAALDAAGINVKVVAAVSRELFRRQDRAWRDRVLSEQDRWDAMVVTNGSWRFMADWCSNPLARQYSLVPDWDSRWRTGGSLDEVMDEAHLSGAHIVAAIERFARDHERRRSYGRSFG
jgi:transketolase